jgi:Ca2+-binding EF-hand superfamily protein
MFDEDKNGFIVMEELLKVLKATHMASDEASVKKKAETIMKQADKDGKLDMKYNFRS